MLEIKTDESKLKAERSSKGKYIFVDITDIDNQEASISLTKKDALKLANYILKEFGE